MAGNAFSLGSLFVELGLKTEDFNRKLGETQRRTETTFGNIQKAAAQLAAVSGVAFGAGALGIRSVVTAAADFEASMYRIQAVSGAAEADIKRLGTVAKQLGADTYFSATQAAGGIEALARGGVSVADIMNGAAEATVHLAAAGKIDLTEAATVTARALSAFHLAGSEAIKVTDLLAGAANSSSTSVQEMAYGFQQAASMAAQMGMPVEDMVTALGLLAQSAIVGSDAGTSLRVMLSRLVPQTDEAARKFEELGWTVRGQNNVFFDAQHQLKSIDEIAGVLQGSLGDLTTEQRTLTLQTLFGQDAIRAAAVIMKAGADGARDFAEALEGIKAKDIADVQMKGLTGAMEELRGSFETMKMSFGEPFLRPFEGFVDAVNTLVDTLAELPAGTREAIALLGTGVTAAAGVTLVAALTALTAPALIAGITALGIGGALAALAAGIGAVVAATTIGTFRNSAENLDNFTKSLQDLKGATSAELQAKLADLQRQLKELSSFGGIGTAMPVDWVSGLNRETLEREIELIKAAIARLTMTEIDAPVTEATNRVTAAVSRAVVQLDPLHDELVKVRGAARAYSDTTRDLADRHTELDPALRSSKGAVDALEPSVKKASASGATFASTALEMQTRIYNLMRAAGLLREPWEHVREELDLTDPKVWAAEYAFAELGRTLAPMDGYLESVANANERMNNGIMGIATTIGDERYALDGWERGINGVGVTTDRASEAAKGFDDRWKKLVAAPPDFSVWETTMRNFRDIILGEEGRDGKRSGGILGGLFEDIRSGLISAFGGSGSISEAWTTFVGSLGRIWNTAMATLMVDGITSLAKTLYNEFLKGFITPAVTKIGELASRALGLGGDGNTASNVLNTPSPTPTTAPTTTGAAALARLSTAARIVGVAGIIYVGASVAGFIYSEATKGSRTARWKAEYSPTSKVVRYAALGGRSRKALDALREGTLVSDANQRAGATELNDDMLVASSNASFGHHFLWVSTRRRGDRLRPGIWGDLVEDAAAGVMVELTKQSDPERNSRWVPTDLAILLMGEGLLSASDIQVDTSWDEIANTDFWSYQGINTFGIGANDPGTLAKFIELAPVMGGNQAMSKITAGGSSSASTPKAVTGSDFVVPSPARGLLGTGISELAKTYAEAYAVMTEGGLSPEHGIDTTEAITWTRALAAIQQAIAGSGWDLSSIPIGSTGATLSQPFTSITATGTSADRRELTAVINVDKFFGSDLELQDLATRLVNIANASGLTLRAVTI